MKTRSQQTWRSKLSLTACCLAYLYLGGAAQWLAPITPLIYPLASGLAPICIVLGLLVGRIMLKLIQPYVVFLGGSMTSVTCLMLISYVSQLTDSEPKIDKTVWYCILTSCMGFSAGMAYLAPSLQVEMHRPGDKETQWTIRMIQMMCSTIGFIIQCFFIPHQAEMISNKLTYLACFWYGICALAGLFMIVGNTNTLLNTANRKALQKLLLGYTQEPLENSEQGKKPYCQMFIKQMFIILTLAFACTPAFLTLIGAFESDYLMPKGALILVVSLGTKILLWLNISALVGVKQIYFSQLAAQYACLMLQYWRQMPGIVWVNCVLAGIGLATAQGLTPQLLQRVYLSEEKANRMFFLYSYPIGTILGLVISILTHYADLWLRVQNEEGESESLTCVYSSLYVSLAIGTLSFLRNKTIKKDKTMTKHH